MTFSKPGRRAVTVDRLTVDDLSAAEVLERCVKAIGAGERCCVAALHISALVGRNVDGFAASLEGFDLVHPDGYSVLLAARLAGADRVERLTTTDLVEQILKATRSLRVAVIGGEAGIAPAAASALEIRFGCQAVFASDGYATDWPSTIDQLTTSRPDLVLVGLGMPTEAIWVARYRESLPQALVMTCGGLPRLLAGHENRAPTLMQRLRLEWLYRLTTDPRRTWRRYLVGAAVCARLYPRIAMSRHRGRPNA